MSGHPRPPALRPQDDIRAAFEAQGVRRWGLAAEDAAARVARLRRLKTAMETARPDLLAALAKDLGKCGPEAHLTELHTTWMELNQAIRLTGRWMKPRRVGTPLTLLGTRSRVHAEPKGRVLIMAPWNYPVFLTLAPLVAALAAGNTVILKPSEKAPATERVLAELLRGAFPPDEVAVFTGGAEVAEALLELPFDHLFFTGSTRVGRIVMAAAAKHLASVTLELGGKSPALLTEGADLDLAARRIAWGKWINAGQTCVAPDYVLVPASLEQPFLDRLKAVTEELFGVAPLGSEAYGTLIDRPAFARQKALLEQGGGEVVFGGQMDEAALRLAPTVLRNVPLASPLMKEEIFGPLLPVLVYKDRAEALAILRDLDEPLASYLFTGGDAEAEAWIRDTRAGGTVVNHTVIHLANPALPFGGRGPSGMGAYHGEHGFLAFSHRRAVLKAGWFDPIRFTSPPYTGRVKAWAFRLLRWLE
ncbi:MAG: aldehyde dehydrogenase family protein [Holophagaceae bacterium]|nr:aldehyde dehydrogenase family protein [Holophagaceae bacterium]